MYNPRVAPSHIRQVSIWQNNNCGFMSIPAYARVPRDRERLVRLAPLEDPLAERLDLRFLPGSSLDY